MQEGCYYKLKFPTLGAEWHPFSLACSEATQRAEFIVKDLGCWTSGLVEQFGAKQQNPAKASVKKVPVRILNTKMDSRNHLNIVHTGSNDMCVRGPCYAPASRLLKERRPMLVCAGIGITPFLSVIHSLIYHHANRRFEQSRCSGCINLSCNACTSPA